MTVNILNSLIFGVVLMDSVGLFVVHAQCTTEMARLLTAGTHLNKLWTMVRQLQEHLGEKKKLYFALCFLFAMFPNMKLFVAFQSCGLIHRHSLASFPVHTKQ